MSASDSGGPFDSIEGAQEYLTMVAETALDTMRDLRRDKETALQEGAARRAQAIDLAIFKLKQFNCHVYKSRRMLNDLRILRRLILNERLSVETIIASM
jgi:hypothetical protein